MLEMKEKFEETISNDKAMGDRDRGAAQAVGEKMKEATSDLAGAVMEKAHDVAAGASKLAGSAMDTAHELASSVADAAVQAKNKTQEAAVAASDMAGEFGRNVTAKVRRQPLTALLISFGAGFLLANLLRRSSSSRT